MRCALCFLTLAFFGAHVVFVSKFERDLVVTLNYDVPTRFLRQRFTRHQQQQDHNRIVPAPGAPALPDLNASSWLSQEEGALCPELMAASRFVSSMPEPPPSINMTMLQLVGKWNEPRQQQMMENAFEHNRKICNNNLGIPAFAITKPPASFGNTEASNSISSTAYWKMRGVRETCAAGYDVVWFLDGDVLLTDADYPIKALWNFHHHFQPQMDILFGVDTNGINTGIFLVNCKSPTALEFLDIWHDNAPQLATYSPSLMEQTFVHYVLDSGKFWKEEIPKQSEFRRNPMPKWDIHSSQARMYPDVWSTQALRAGRLHAAHSQCAMSAYRQMRRIDLRRVWQPGDVSVHLAGIGPKDKRRFIGEFLDKLPQLANEDEHVTDQKDVALAYLQSHQIVPGATKAPPLINVA